MFLYGDFFAGCRSGYLSLFGKPNQERRKRNPEDDKTEYVEGVCPLQACELFFEQKHTGHSPRVASGAYDARDHSQRLLIDKRHYTVGGTFTHLYKEAEENERHDDEGDGIHSGKKDQGKPLHKERYEQPFHPAIESADFAKAVSKIATQ